MDEEFEEDGWMGRHRSGEDEVCFWLILLAFFRMLFGSNKNFFTASRIVPMKLWKIHKRCLANVCLNLPHQII